MSFSYAKIQQKGLKEVVKSVYVMFSDGNYKIGVSKNPKERIKVLSLGNCNIQLIYQSPFISNAFYIESILHKTFNENAIGREWFKVNNENKIIETIEKIISEFGNVQKEENEKEIMCFVEDEKEIYKLEEWIKKENEELQKLKIENEELQKFIYTLQGNFVPNMFTDLIYKVLFDEKVNQIREEYKLKKNEDLKNYLTSKELKAVQSMECLVSGLVDCGWEYNKVKQFIENNNSKRIAA